MVRTRGQADPERYLSAIVFCFDFALDEYWRITGVPGNNTFILNDVKGFHASLAGVFIDAGVSNTIVVGRPITVEDHGVGTVIVPVP